jgi:hypothetical protein
LILAALRPSGVPSNAKAAGRVVPAGVKHARRQLRLVPSEPRTANATYPGNQPERNIYKDRYNTNRVG